MRSAEEIRNAIRVGWNLGNALDTFPRPGGGEKEGETGWGNPITTKAMIDAVAAKGFNIIRIPVTWFPYVDDANNYRIDPTHLARVRKVVDYAMENQVFAILNLHHENQWLIPQWKRYETVKKKYCRIWEQIADYFKDYPDLLLFEAMNEPRIEGAENEWEGGTGEVREVLNSLQGEFIKLIRNSDGNNKTRSLLITTAGASAAESALAGLVLPNDENVMVSLHIYLPFCFCTTTKENGGTAVWDGTYNSVLEETFERIDRMILQKGTGVLLTEFGAIAQNNDAEIGKWIEKLLFEASSHGIKGIWWDNNYEDTPGDSFAIFRRTTCEWIRPDVTACLLKCRA